MAQLAGTLQGEGRHGRGRDWVLLRVLDLAGINRSLGHAPPTA
jgi:hypothetical protein